LNVADRVGRHSRVAEGADARRGRAAYLPRKAYFAAAASGSFQFAPD
jgi:hypothetical protein